MKFLNTLAVLIFIAGCDPYGFGYKKNPAFVLSEAFKAVRHLDDEAFLNVSGKEALCLYGNPQGMAYLKKRLKIDTEEVDIEPKVVEQKYFKTPLIVGSPAYRSYYHEKYIVKIVNKTTREGIINTIVECDFGYEGAPSRKYLDKKPQKYPIKECRLTKVMPLLFAGIPFQEEVCGNHLRVNFKSL